ncbi:MAG: class I SAM-dependent methyltransferase [Flavobacteriales bacterium]
MSTWKDRYNEQGKHDTPNLQFNVDRTKGGVVVSEDIWDRTVCAVIKHSKISKDSVVMEVCCGNGMLLGPISKICKKAIGVDFSVQLLAQLNAAFPNSVETHLADALEFEWKKEELDVVLIYFAIQCFSERNALRLISRAFSWLKVGGVLFIGDVPDEEKKWGYLSKPEYRRDYLTRVETDTPMIGQWFRKEFFKALEDYIPCMQVTLIDQPSYQINSEIRYDVVIRKVRE